MKALTLEQMRSVNGGSVCGDIEAAIVVLAAFQQHYAVVFLSGAWLANRCYAQ